jgi:glutamate-1-semialdehyde aminotransferase
MNWRERAESVTPGGSQTRSKRRLFDAPVALQGAQYQHTWDREGNTFIDWISGLCAIGLGHGWPEVDEAVERQIHDHGTCLSLPSYLEVEVAELLLETLGWGEQVRWVKTGSEATGGAMLIARAATNRRVIISIGYHGWTSSHLPSPYLWDCEWGNLRELQTLLGMGSVAGVLLEPMRDHEPPEGYLEGVQQLAKDHGALFIIDEVVTGFRWAIGGATEYYGLHPDLACFGKAMANGFPVGCIIGRRNHMQYADRVSSTFGGEGIGLAATGATIESYRAHDVIKQIWSTGQALKDALNLDGYPCYPRFKMNARENATKLAANGVLIHPAKGVFVPTFSHTDIDVKATVKALHV